MGALQEAAIRDYTDHFAHMNPTLDACRAAERTYRNMELMYGPLMDRLRPGQAVVDLGCGVGFSLYWLSRRPALRLIGVDASERQLALARKAVPQAELLHINALDFLRDKSAVFGAFFCIDMIEHLETDNDCFHLLSRAYQALEPGGFFVCRVPNAANILASFHRHIDITHHRIFTSYSLRQAMAAAGFADIQFVPHRSSALLGKIRLVVEYLLHRSLFFMSGYPRKNIYTENVVAVGFKP